MDMQLPPYLDNKVAEAYELTHPMDPIACRACFRFAFQSISPLRKALILDVGSGTGRILECLVPELLNATQITDRKLLFGGCLGWGEGVTAVGD